MPKRKKGGFGPRRKYYYRSKVKDSSMIYVEVKEEPDWQEYEQIHDNMNNISCKIEPVEMPTYNYGTEDKMVQTVAEDCDHSYAKCPPEDVSHNTFYEGSDRDVTDRLCSGTFYKGSNCALTYGLCHDMFYMESDHDVTDVHCPDAFYKESDPPLAGGFKPYTLCMVNYMPVTVTSGTSPNNLYMVNCLPVFGQFHYTTYENERIEIDREEVIVETESFQDFVLNVKESIRGRGYCIHETGNDLTLIQLSDNRQAIKLTVNFNSDFKCSVYVHRKPIVRSHILWEDMPYVFLNIKSVLKLLDRIKTFTVCSGNPEEDYHKFVPIGGYLPNNTGPGMAAYREGDFGVEGSLGQHYNSTIRTVSCELLTKKNVKCLNCMRYGYALRKRQIRIENRASKDMKFMHSTFKHKDMTRGELCKKLDEQRNEIAELKQTVIRLQRNFDKSVKTYSVNLEEQKHNKSFQTSGVNLKDPKLDKSIKTKGVNLRP